MWSDSRTSPRLWSSDTSIGANLILGLSRSRRTATLVTLLKATSMMVVDSSTSTNNSAVNSSVPLNIETFGEGVFQWLASLHRLFRDHTPRGVRAHGAG